MFGAIGVLAVVLILFALCKTQEWAFDEQRDFWIKARQVLDQLRQSEYH